jgi:type I restriction enzyme S subunit
VSHPEIRLKYVATLNNEALGEDTDPDYELQYIDIGNVDSSGHVHEVASYRFADAPSRARRRVRHGDVIVSCVRTYLQAIAPIENPPDNLIVSTGFAVVRPLEGRLRGGFCKYALREPRFLAEVERRSVGVSYPAINSTDLAAIPIPAPPDDAQLRIEKFLDRETARIDALIGAKQRLLDLLAEKRKAIIAAAVTRGLDPKVELRDSGVPWLGEIPAHWEAMRVRHLISSLDQGWSPEAENREPTIDEWGVLKLNAVSQGAFDPMAAKTLLARMAPRPDIEVDSGDVLITRANTPSLVGDACFVEETRPKLMLCDLIYRLRVDPERVDARFLVNFLVTSGRPHPEMTARGTSNSMVKLSQEHIKDWWVPVPPLDEQRAIVDHIARETAKLDAVRAATERTIALLKERRSALIAAAVTGQLDLTTGEGAAA